ncbi:hypothetical protein HF324_14905 [Chitinophaga oryzae]|uniref:Thioredoxin-like fold domain-containing protein n=1 Tax=Chitinophaga oryzae TaxID=2725414 RepID=A0ABX6LGD1_9BACT|nr:hypothetical protein HF324_14905 [Chitinophaga oryzae]
MNGIDSLPSFNILLLDSASVLNTKNFSDSDDLVMFLFDPYCEHCRAETESIVNSMEILKRKQFCFISVAKIEDLRSFSKNYRLDRFQNIHVGVDTGFVYIQSFRVRNVPHTTVFSRNRLRKVFVGATEAKALLK